MSLIFFTSQLLFPNLTSRQEILDKTASDIRQLTGRKVLAVTCDVREPQSVKEAVDTCESTFGIPDIVVNNAAGELINLPFCSLLLFFLQ